MSLLPIGGGLLDVTGTATPQDVTAVVCNAATGAQSEYTNFNFNSLATIGDISYGCTAGRVYSLEGNTDNGTPIAAVVTTGLIDFSDEKTSEPALRLKRMDSCYLNVRVAPGGMAVRVVVDEEIDRVYLTGSPTIKHEGLSPLRLKMGKGLQGRNWQFGIESIDGGDFELERMDVVPIILSRRY